jgi:hypothetical protein
MYWQLFKLIIFTFAPYIPVNPKIRRPDPTKNLWTLECTRFESVYQAGTAMARENSGFVAQLKRFYTESPAADLLKRA